MSERKKPHILFVTEKWCDLNPKAGDSNNDHNLIGSLESSELATYEQFHYDQFWLKYNFPWWTSLVKQAHDCKPDLIVLSWVPMSHPMLDSMPKPEIFNMLRDQMQIPIVAIWFDTAGSAIGDPFLPYVDLNIVLDSSSSLVRTSQPDKYLHLWTPQDTRLFYNPSIERDINISFVGTLHTNPRINGINTLKKNNIDIYHSGGQRSNQRLSPEEYARVFMRSKIALNFPYTGHNLYQCKGRVFEATLCGAMLLEGENPETSKWLEPNVDYVSFTDEIDLVEKVKYYLEHDDERVEIAAKGYKKAKDKYTGATFWQAVFQRFGLRNDLCEIETNPCFEIQQNQINFTEESAANTKSRQTERTFLRFKKISELFSEILYQTNLLNIKGGYELPERDGIALESLVQKIAKNGIKAVEIGSWKGMGTAVIGGVLSDYKGTLFAIDNWKGSSDVPWMEKEARETDILNLFIKNMRVLGLFDSVVKPMAMDSIVASQIFQDNTLDFVFIDGEHSYSSVKQDISTWLPKLKEGGTIGGHCGDGYYSQYPEIVKAEIDRQCEVDYIRIEGVGVHPGVVKALYDIFADRYKIMPDSTLWYYQKTMDSQWSATRSKLKTSNAYHAAHVKILLNILGETTKKEHLDLSFPSQGDIHQSERISLVAQYCTQGWIGDLIQLGFKGIETTKKLAAVAITSNRRLMIVPLDEAETQYISSIPKDFEPYKDVVDIISSCSLTPETIELIKNKEFCFAFIDGLDTYDACLTAIKTVAHCSGVLAIDNMLQNSEISRAFLQGSELTHRSKLYLPDCQEAYLLWPLA